MTATTHLAVKRVVKFGLFFVIATAARAARAQLDAQITVVGSATGGNGNPSFNEKVDNSTDFIHRPATATLTKDANAGVADSIISGTVTANIGKLGVDFSGVSTISFLPHRLAEPMTLSQPAVHLRMLSSLTRRPNRPGWPW
jgi:hypothetical protein